MEQAVVKQSATVLSNIQLGLAGDREKEDAIALFRVAACVGPRSVLRLVEMPDAIDEVRR